MHHNCGASDPGEAYRRAIACAQAIEDDAHLAEIASSPGISVKRPTPDHRRRDPNAWNLDDASVVENVELLDWAAQSKLPLLGAGADPNVRNNAG